MQTQRTAPQSLPPRATRGTPLRRASLLAVLLGALLSTAGCEFARKARSRLSFDAPMRRASKLLDLDHVQNVFVPRRTLDWRKPIDAFAASSARLAKLPQRAGKVIGTLGRDAHDSLTVPDWRGSIRDFQQALRLAPERFLSGSLPVHASDAERATDPRADAVTQRATLLERLRRRFWF